MLTRFRDRAEDEAGITLSEVLVVIMIIGLMAGMAVPGFVCQKGRASDDSSKVVARAAAAAMETYANDNLGAYDGATPSILNSINKEVPTNITLTAQPNCPSNVCFEVETPANPTSGVKYKLTKRPDGSLDSECSSHGNFGCPSDGNWSAE